MLHEQVKIGDIVIGRGAPAVFLPDIGTFFNQDVARGLALIDRVADAGAQVIKGEVLHDARICLDTDLLENITTRDAVLTKEPYRRVIERKVLPLGAYEKLFAHATRRTLRLALSVYDAIGLEFALAQGASLVKIASSNVVHRPLVEQAAVTGVPVLMDTGGATLQEVTRAVQWFESTGGTQLIIEHSPPGPPAPVARHNLPALATYREAFRCPVGLSDHHAGVEMLHAAIALGANVIEKGVYPDEVERDQDVAHGLPISRLAATLRQCANISAALLVPDPLIAAGHPARMGLTAARDVPAGHVLILDDLAYAFPAVGVPVEQVNEAIGCRVIRAVAAGQPLTWSVLQRD